MSNVSLVLSGSKPRIGVCPDIHKPPQLLENIVDIDLPETIAVRRGDGTLTEPVHVDRILRLLNEDAVRKEKALFVHVPDEKHSFGSNSRPFPRDSRLSDKNLTRAFAKYLANLVKTLRKSVEVDAVTMGGVDHLILGLPPYISAPAHKKLETIGDFFKKLRITIVPYHASVMLFHGKGKIEKNPFIDVSWDSELHIGRRSFPQGSVDDMAFIGNDSILKTVSHQGWHNDLSLWLIDKYKDNIRENVQWGKKQELKFRRWAKNVTGKLLEALLNGEKQFPVEYGEWNDTVCHKDMKNLTASLLHAPANYLRAALRDHGANERTLIISHGRMLNYHVIESMFNDVFLEFGVINLEEDTDVQAALGAFLLAKPSPCVPYDCGVLVRTFGEHEGVGTLVLLRGSPVGTRSHSRTFNMLRHESQNVEVFFYTRQVDFVNSKVNYKFAKKKVRFAPDHDASGTTRFYASMNLQTDDGGRVNAVRTVLHDEISGNSYDFPSLPFTGGSKDIAAIRRGNSSKEAQKWRRKIAAVSGSKPQWSIRQWEEAMEDKNNKDKMTRDDYIFFIFELDMITHLRDFSLFTCPPEELQRRGRSHAYDQMVELANQVGGANVSAWRRHYTQPTRDSAMPREFQNSVFQDAVDRPKLQDRAEKLAEKYNIVCMKPEVMNVDWDKTMFANSK